MAVGAAPAPGHCPHPLNFSALEFRSPHTPGAHHILPKGFRLGWGWAEGV